MKLKRILALTTTLALLAGMATSAFATGYVTPPTTPGYTYDPPGYEYDPDGTDSGGGSGYYGNTGGGFVPSTNAGGSTGSTTIRDNNTPTTSAPTTGLKNNNGAKPLTANAIGKGQTNISNVSTLPTRLLNGLSQTVSFDVKVGGVILSRMYLDPKTSSSLPETLDVSMSFDKADTQKTESKFAKYFGGNNAVVSLAHKGSFGTSVKMGVRTSQLKNVDLNNLKVIVYNKSTNSYVKVAPENVIIEGSYVYINIETGGEIVFTDSDKF